MLRSVLAFLLAAAIAASDVPLRANIPQGREPQQLRIGFGHTPQTMRVAWSVFANDTSTVETRVQFGLSSEKLDMEGTDGHAVLFTKDPGRLWSTVTASMTLEPSTRYFYRVGGPVDGWSRIFSFTSQADRTTLEASLPQVHVLYGDMGAAFAYSLCPGCGSAERCDCDDDSRGVVSESPDMILHMGDFAYNMDSNNGTTADAFFRNIEPVAARFPYMVCHGNHEDSDVALARFTESWRHMPSNRAHPTVRTVNGEAPNNWFFSWDEGLVHYVSISTEIQGGAMLKRAGTT